MEDKAGSVSSTPADPKGNSFGCFLCGICCSRYQVRLSLNEARNICDRLGCDWQQFVLYYTDQRWPGEKSLLIKHKNGACIFLKRSSGQPVAICNIHRYKPSSCVEWTASPFRRECREGLARYWGLQTNPEGQVTGEPDKLMRFEGFMASLSDEYYEPGE